MRWAAIGGHGTAFDFSCKTLVKKMQELQEMGTDLNLPPFQGTASAACKHTLPGCRLSSSTPTPDIIPFSLDASQGVLDDTFLKWFPSAVHRAIRLIKEPACYMRAYKVETTIPQDGVLELDSLPFRAGEAVEVIILSRAKHKREAVRGSLRGKVLQYDRPTEPVAEEDWDALR